MSWAFKCKLFQYPILRIVGCKRAHSAAGSPSSAIFQYPILRIVGCKCSHSRARSMSAPGLSVSYPADRWLQVPPQNVHPRGRTTFSILSCGSLVASWVLGAHRRHCHDHFQYPILRIVGCKMGPPPESQPAATAFSILSCGSLVASGVYGGGLRRSAGLSVSYPADRWLQDGRSATKRAGSTGLSVSYPADRWLQDCQGLEARGWQPIFQYPILRIVGCKRLPCFPIATHSESTFSILSCGSLVASP